MAYCVESDLYAYVSQEDMAPFTDDSGAGPEDTNRLSQIIATAQLQVDGPLAAIYTVPISPTPVFCKMATIIFTCEALYARRLEPDIRNPFTTTANNYRKMLQMIALGEMGLDAGAVRAFTPGAAIQVPIVFNQTTI
jgi:phage gp36-like protein